MIGFLLVTRILRSIRRFLYARMFNLTEFILHLYWVVKANIFKIMLRQYRNNQLVEQGTQAYVINLHFRTDRLEEVSRTFKSCEIDNWIRVDAISHQNGALGCALSHKLALHTASNDNLEYVMIFEDDVILGPSFNQELLSKILSEFLENRSFAIMCLAFSSESKGIRVSENLWLDDRIATAAAYVIKREYIGVLQNSFSSSVDLLEQGVINRLAAIDIRWMLTQKRICFVRPVAPIFVQKPGWSNIENMNVDY
jgi:glycosyl transferase family 25